MTTCGIRPWLRAWSSESRFRWSLPSVADPVDLLADRDLIQRALTVLEPDEREAIALRYGADLTVPEIAKLTKLPLSTVEGRVYRGLRKLREELG